MALFVKCYTFVIYKQYLLLLDNFNNAKFQNLFANFKRFSFEFVRYVGINFLTERLESSMLVGADDLRGVLCGMCEPTGLFLCHSHAFCLQSSH